MLGAMFGVAFGMKVAAWWRTRQRAGNTTLLSTRTRTEQRRRGCSRNAAWAYKLPVGTILGKAIPVGSAQGVTLSTALRAALGLSLNGVYTVLHYTIRLALCLDQTWTVTNRCTTLSACSHGGPLLGKALE